MNGFSRFEMRFDYQAAAELFTGRSARGARPMRYHRFDTGAEAVQFAIETLTAEQLLAAVLKIDENRYRHGEIRAFYESTAYPLPRKKVEVKKDEAKKVESKKAPERVAAAAPKQPAARKRATKTKPAARKSKPAERKSSQKSMSAA
jgi:hypothetical protein